MEFSRKDLRTLADLFSESCSGKDSSREVVARCWDFGLSRFEIQSILPCNPLSSKVINIVAAYLCETQSDWWYFPTYFGDIAQLYDDDTSKVQVGVGTTINMCRLQRFHRRLQQCTKA